MKISIPQNAITQIAAYKNWPGEEAIKVYLYAVKDVVPINSLF